MFHILDFLLPSFRYRGDVSYFFVLIFFLLIFFGTVAIFGSFFRDLV